MPDEPFMLVSLKGDKAKKLAQVMASPTCTLILEHLAQAKEATESQVAKNLNIPLSTVHYNLAQLVAAKLVLVEEFHYSAKGREVNHYKLANKYIIIAPKDEDPSFLDRLKRIIPAAVLTVGVAVVLKTMQLITPGGSAVIAPDGAATPALYALPEAAPAPVAQRAMDAGAQAAGEAAVMKTADATAGAAGSVAAQESVNTLSMIAADTTAQNTSAVGIAPSAFNETIVAPVDPITPSFDPSPIAQQPHWWQAPMIEWFLAGAAFVLIIIILNELFSYWREKRSRKR